MENLASTGKLKLESENVKECNEFDLGQYEQQKKQMSSLAYSPYKNIVQ